MNNKLIITTLIVIIVILGYLLFYARTNPTVSVPLIETNESDMKEMEYKEYLRTSTK